MKIKYPRTCHLPFSKGITNDDKVLKSLSLFEGKQVVITEKMDGENTTIYSDGFHARSLDSRNQPYRNWISNYIRNFSYKIPEGYRICGENLFASHSIFYENLKSYFYAFSVWDDNNVCLNWNDTVEFLNSLDVYVVPYLTVENEIIVPRIFDLEELIYISNHIDTSKVEGFVVRTTESFSYNEFPTKVAKWVRPNHVTSDKHWMHQEIKKNRLANE